MNSISIDKKIQFVTRRAYLHTDSKRFFTDSNDWETECLWVDICIQTAHMRTNVSTETNPTPKLMVFIRNFSNSLPNSNV